MCIKHCPVLSRWYSILPFLPLPVKTLTFILKYTMFSMKLNITNIYLEIRSKVLTIVSNIMTLVWNLKRYHYHIFSILWHWTHFYKYNVLSFSCSFLKSSNFNEYRICGFIFPMVIIVIKFIFPLRYQDRYYSNF